MAAFFLWCILFILCWPLALLAIVLFPIVWLVTLPFRILGIAVHGVFALLAALFFFARTRFARSTDDLSASYLGPGGNLRVRHREALFLERSEGSVCEL